MRKLGAVMIGLLLLAAVGVAYNQCSQGSGPSCGTTCAGVSTEQASACGSCAYSEARAKCDGDCATCECPDAGKCSKKCADCPDGACAKVSGTVRYTRSTNKAVKVMNGEDGYLLRVSRDCGGCQAGLMKTISGLEKGDSVEATYRKCPKSGKYYICTLKVANEGTS